MSEWEDVGSLLEDLKKIKIILGIILGIIVGGVFFYVFSFVANITAGFGDYILQTLNETGFTIPASANYVALIESLASSALLILRTASRPSVFIGIILAVVGIVVVLLKRYGGLSV